ncbi:uncharacterized protein [Littorina saxatilis]|uniref:Ribosomal protein S11 n=1 Tax=Littorina saxatilis TaxID=31220 RepID=A0AAN9GNL7_9CAEN
MLKSALTTLCKLHGRHALCQQLRDTSVVQRVQSIHATSCLQVLDKDSPGKKSAKKLREEESEIAAPPDVDLPLQDFKMESMFPSLETHSMLINGVRYDELPIIHIKATHNNTIITVTNGKGDPIAMESAGTVGFRNARKGTNIAAQAAAISLAEKAIKNGVELARICVRGIGPGRLPAIKGLQMSGITAVSITDNTRLPFNGSRPKKQRRL